MGLVLDWQRKLGYSKDPFAPATGTSLVGLDSLKERINLFLIKDERFGTISGPPGSGKSSLLQWINDQLAPQKSHAQHLLSAREGKKEEIIDKLLSSRLSFLERKFGKALKASVADKEKDLLQRFAQENKNVLLVDDAGALGKHELELFATILQRTPTHVIFTDTEEQLKKVGLPGHDLLKLKVPEYSGEQIVAMLENRIGDAGGSGTFPFDEKELTGLVKKSGHNPAKFFSLAKERAIELSIKIKASPPPMVRRMVVPHEPKIKTGKFFTISVQKVPAGHASKPVIHVKPPSGKEKAHIVPPPSLPEGEVADAGKLAQIIQEAENPEPKQQQSNHKSVLIKAPDDKMENLVVEKPKKLKEGPKTKHDKIVERLAEEFDRNPPVAPNRPMKKKAKKTAKKKR